MPASPFETSYTALFKAGDAEIPYTVCRSRRRRRSIALSFGAEHGLRILTPLKTRAETIHSILHHRRDWIERRLHQLANFPRFNSAEEFSDGSFIPFLGRELLVQIVKGAKAACDRVGDRLEITLKDPSAPDAPRRIRKLALKWYKERAREEVLARINGWAEKIGVKYRGVFIGNARRLWGSCSARNDIRINWRIVMAPPALLDCLLAHELCHVAHKNHSQRFWRLMEKTIPDHRAHRRHLRVLEPDLLRRGR